MSELNRRDMMRAAAGGGRAPIRRAHTAVVRAALQRAGCPMQGEAVGGDPAPMPAALVSACRSWDSQVHLALADGRSGLCAPDARGLGKAVGKQLGDFMKAEGKQLFLDALKEK